MVIQQIYIYIISEAAPRELSSGLQREQPKGYFEERTTPEIGASFEAMREHCKAKLVYHLAA